MIRLAFILTVIAAPIGAVLAYGDPADFNKTTIAISHVLKTDA